MFEKVQGIRVQVLNTPDWKNGNDIHVCVDILTNNLKKNLENSPKKIRALIG